MIIIKPCLLEYEERFDLLPNNFISLARIKISVCYAGDSQVTRTDYDHFFTHVSIVVR